LLKKRQAGYLWKRDMMFAGYTQMVHRGEERERQRKRERESMSKLLGWGYSSMAENREGPPGQQLGG
jgi:hypothetical protein